MKWLWSLTAAGVVACGPTTPIKKTSSVGSSGTSNTFSSGATGTHGTGSTGIHLTSSTGTSGIHVSNSSGSGTTGASTGSTSGSGTTGVHTTGVHTVGGTGATSTSGSTTAGSHSSAASTASSASSSTSSASSSSGSHASSTGSHSSSTSSATSSSGSTGGGLGECARCTANSDCASGACAAEGLNAPSGFCAGVCTSSHGCSDAASSCTDLFSDGDSFCYPNSNTCQAGSSSSGGTTGAPGTVCTSCTQGSDCGTDGACVTEVSNGPGYCAPACDDNFHCADPGTSCQDLSGNSDFFCYPTAGRCGPPSALCQTCTSDAACGSGNACLFDSSHATSGHCVVACTSFGDCDDPGAVCQDVTGNFDYYCYPDTGSCPSASPTTGSSSGGSSGSTGSSGNTCQTCAATSECATGSHCLQEGGGGTDKFCGRECTGTSDTSCGANYTCHHYNSAGGFYACRAEAAACP